MAKISEAATLASYEIAKQVEAGTLNQQSGLDILEKQFALNRGSGSDFIAAFRRMRMGVYYTRTLNEFSTRHYISRISQDFGVEAGRLAVAASRAHLIYYHGVSGSWLKGVEKICNEFEHIIGVDDRIIFESEVAAALQLTEAQRQSASSRYKLVPERHTISITVFRRNPNTVATVLSRAGGVCEICNLPAPFARISDGTPFLEVHHIIQLSANGLDTPENAIAVCPNCHRRRHFG